MFKAIGTQIKDTAVALKDGAVTAAIATKDAAVYTAEVSYDVGVATAAAIDVSIVEPSKQELRVVWENIDTQHGHSKMESMNMALFRTCLDGGVQLHPDTSRKAKEEVDETDLQVFFVRQACRYRHCFFTISKLTLTIFFKY